MKFSAGVVALLAAPAAMAFIQPSVKARSAAAFTASRFDSKSTFANEKMNKAMTELKMAFDLEEGQVSNMFEGPTPLVQERDACGVGFIANTQNGGMFIWNRLYVHFYLFINIILTLF
jgi:hypothetical protein